MAYDFSRHGMPPPLVHIGYPKALSSWLQKHLFKPEQGFINALDSLRTTISVIDPTPFRFDESVAARFIDETLAACPVRDRLVPVCSAEALVGNPYCGGFNARQNADRIHQLFPDARILLVVREQRQLMRSLYKTLVVWGMPHTIRRLLHPRDTSLAPQFSLDFLRFDLLTAYYQQLFGRDNVLVLPYEAFTQDPQAFVRRILQHAGREPTAAFSKLPWQKRLNANQPLAEIYLQRLLNLLLSSPFNYAGPVPSTEAGVHRRIRRSKSGTLPTFTRDWFEDDFRQTVAAAFAGQFGDSNRRLQALTGLALGSYGYDLAEAHHTEQQPR